MTEGATAALDRLTTIAPEAGDSLWVAGAGSAVTLRDSTLSYGTRGITVEDGGNLSARGLEVYSTSETALLLSGGSGQLRDLVVEGGGRFGLYLSDGVAFTLEGGDIRGVTEAAVLARQAGPVQLSDLTLTSARDGIVIEGGAGATVERVHSVLQVEQGIHLLADNATVTLQSGHLQGGALGVAAMNGGAEVRDSVIADTTNSAVYVDGQGTGAVSVQGSDLIAGLEGLPVYADRPVELIGNRLIFEGTVAAGKGIDASLVRHNLVFGPQDDWGANWGEAPAVPDHWAFANQLADLGQVPEVWCRVQSAADLQSRVVALAELSRRLPGAGKPGALAQGAMKICWGMGQ